VKVVVMSKPGREPTTMQMLLDLDRQNPGVPVWLYRSTAPGVPAFYEILAAAGHGDLLFLEDDIVTTRNFLRYAAAWQSPHLTSFFHVTRPLLGAPVPARGFSFSQAVKLPSRVIAMLRATPRIMHGGGQDDEIGHALGALGEPVIYHRSLVQHVGAISVTWGGMTLAHRAALDFPGEDFDCLSLLACPRCPRKETEHVTSTLHDRYTRCPKPERLTMENERDQSDPSGIRTRDHSPPNPTISPANSPPLNGSTGESTNPLPAPLSGAVRVDEVVSDGLATLVLGTVSYEPGPSPIPYVAPSAAAGYLGTLVSETRGDVTKLATSALLRVAAATLAEPLAPWMFTVRGIAAELRARAAGPEAAAADNRAAPHLTETEYESGYFQAIADLLRSIGEVRP
jgi:hypothetical protein